jgi:hypothetical protein
VKKRKTDIIEEKYAHFGLKQLIVRLEKLPKNVVNILNLKGNVNIAELYIKQTEKINEGGSKNTDTQIPSSSAPVTGALAKIPKMSEPTKSILKTNAPTGNTREKEHMF